MAAKNPLDAFIETLKREPKTHATGSICKPGTEMKREETLQRHPSSPPLCSYPTQGQASEPIVNAGAEMKRETKLEPDFKLRKMPDDHVWVTGNFVQVTSMNGVSVNGVVMTADSLEGAPLKPGHWYWVWTETGEKWVHESLVRGA